MEIYLITDTTNGKQYVGQTINTKEERWRTHLSGNLYIDKAIRSHKAENFKLQTLEFVDNKEILDVREQYWIDKLGTLVPGGYNILSGGNCHAGQSVTMDIEKYLKNIYYPNNNLKNPKRVKMYILLRDVCYNIVDNYVHFDKLSTLDMIRWQEHFWDWSREYLTENVLSEIADKTIFFPSLNSIKRFNPDECYKYLTGDYVKYYIDNNMFISFDSEYIESKYVGYATYVDDGDKDEYDKYVKSEIDLMLERFNKEPEVFNEFIKKERYLKKVKSDADKKKSIQKQIRRLNDKKVWLKKNTDKHTIRVLKNGSCRVRVFCNDNEKVFNSICGENDAVTDACNWVLSITFSEFTSIDEYLDIIDKNLKYTCGIKQYSISGEIVAEYDSINEASECTGFNRQLIKSCCENKIVVSNGFLWCYVGQENIIDIKTKILNDREERKKQNKQKYKDQYKYTKKALREREVEQKEKIGKDFLKKRPMGVRNNTK